jgi:hypothetical protein
MDSKVRNRFCNRLHNRAAITIPVTHFNSDMLIENLKNLAENEVEI